MQQYQKIIYLILEEPSSSIFARLIFLLLIAAILISTGEGLFITQETVFLNSSILTLDCAISIVFALEIIFRILSTKAFGRKMRKYVLSPIFIVDIIAVIPIFSEIQYFRIEIIDLKLISLLKITAIFKLIRYIKHTSILVKGITNSLSSLGFLTLVIIINTLGFGILIYYVERNQPNSNFNEGIPTSLWWAIVTMSTVGYGDVIPITIPGKVIASILAIIGMLMLTLPVAILGFHFQEAYNDHQEEIMIENLKGNQFEGRRDLDQRAKEIQFLNERIETIEQYNQNIMKALEHSSDIYKKVSRDLRVLYKSIYAEAELENKKIEHKNSFSMKLELMERLARTKRKIKLVTVFKAGVGRSRGELSPELPKTKKMSDLIKKQNSPSHQDSDEESSIFSSISTDSINEFSNRDNTVGDPSTFVGKVLRFSSKPSFMLKERSKSFDKNIVKTEQPEKRHQTVIQKKMFSFKNLSQMNSDDILSDQKVQSQSRTPSTILDSRSPDSCITRDITQSNNRLLTAAACMRRSMEKNRSSILSNSTSPLYNEDFVYRQPSNMSTNVIILNKDPGRTDRRQPSFSKGYS